MDTEQMNFWSGEFGEDCTDRNTYTPEGIDLACQELFGVRRTEMNKSFLGRLDRECHILEVGCNIGIVR